MMSLAFSLELNYRSEAIKIKKMPVPRPHSQKKVKSWPFYSNLERTARDENLKYKRRKSAV